MAVKSLEAPKLDTIFTLDLAAVAAAAAKRLADCTADARPVAPAFPF